MTTKNDPYAEGREAFDAGKGEDANPYDLSDNESAHLMWNDGWSDAADDDLE